MDNRKFSLAVLVCLSLISPAVFSYQGYITQPPRSDFYVGIDAGIGVINWNSSPVTLNPRASFVPPLTAQATHGRSGATGGVFIGYADRFDRFYLGGELFAELNDLRTSFHSIDSFGIFQPLDIEVNLKDSYGAALLPGFYLSNFTKLFARLGFARGYAQVNADSSSGNNVNGYQLGFGLDTQLAGQFIVRGEYKYTRYQSFNRTIQGNSVRFPLETNQFMLGLIYLFC